MLSEPSPEGLLTGSWLDASFPVPRWQMALHLQGFAYEQSSRRGLCDSALWNASPHSVPRPSRCASHCRSRSRYRYRYLPYGVSVGRNHHTRATSTTHDPRPTAWPTQQAR
ncbi:hypothetical protein QC763_0027270 [Podospora pseudopauciseta]|uniref:Uncharacterized protein n=1 Tax=Podospora pseudopauciseta TaxID=2093780 RepID=A0ABR0I472_9PEZI|nr:hypothetical protein QC763_0027270 [Podospora pseudopauciseta]